MCNEYWNVVRFHLMLTRFWDLYKVYVLLSILFNISGTSYREADIRIISPIFDVLGERDAYPFSCDSMVN